MNWGEEKESGGRRKRVRGGASDKAAQILVIINGKPEEVFNAICIMKTETCFCFSWLSVSIVSQLVPQDDLSSYHGATYC